MPVEWIQAINPVFILVLTPFVNALWRRQSQVGKEPKPIAKMAIGCALLSAGYGTPQYATPAHAPANELHSSGMSDFFS